MIATVGEVYDIIKKSHVNASHCGVWKTHKLVCDLLLTSYKA